MIDIVNRIPTILYSTLNSYLIENDFIRNPEFPYVDSLLSTIYTAYLREFDNLHYNLNADSYFIFDSIFSILHGFPSLGFIVNKRTLELSLVKIEDSWFIQDCMDIDYSNYYYTAKLKQLFETQCKFVYEYRNNEFNRIYFLTYILYALQFNKIDLIPGILNSFAKYCAKSGSSLDILYLTMACLVSSIVYDYIGSPLQIPSTFWELYKQVTNQVYLENLIQKSNFDTKYDLLEFTVLYIYLMSGRYSFLTKYIHDALIHYMV